MLSFLTIGLIGLYIVYVYIHVVMYVYLYVWEYVCVCVLEYGTGWKAEPKPDPTRNYSTHTQLEPKNLNRNPTAKLYLKWYSICAQPNRQDCNQCPTQPTRL